MLTCGWYHVCPLPLEGVYLIVMETLSYIVAPSFVLLRGYEQKGTSLGSLSLLEAFEATLVSCAFPKSCSYPLEKLKVSHLVGLASLELDMVPSLTHAFVAY